MIRILFFWRALVPTTQATAEICIPQDPDEMQQNFALQSMSGGIMSGLARSGVVVG